jgi:dipeptidyl aminopeptidase/acylaminoacyl peptidase
MEDSESDQLFPAFCNKAPYPRLLIWELMLRMNRNKNMRRLFKLLLVGTGLYLLLSGVAGIFIAEGSLKLGRRAVGHRLQVAEVVRQRYGAELQEVSVNASDSAVLKGWYVRPSNFNHQTVVLLHGITDNREGVAGYAPIFLDRGYAVLLPDARAHGESGGEIATYGVKESDDLHRWISWLYLHDTPQCVYGFGESYGAALMLQSLADETRYCAVAVEDSFSTAREMSFERVSGPLHLGNWFGKTLGRPMIAIAEFYARERYGIDLLAPSPLKAVTHSKVPILLIHGTEDHTISPNHSIILAQASPEHTRLWLVPGAWHTGAWSVAREEFESRVLGWFGSHQQVG